MGSGRCFICEPGWRRRAVACAAALALLCACALALGAACAPAAHADTAKKAVAHAKKAPTYKIIYKLKGGTQPAKQVLVIKKGKTLKTSKLKKPTRTGYTFKGWYTSAKYKVKAKVLVGAKKKSQRRVYAKWKKKSYKLSYTLNGGKLPKKAITSYKYSGKATTLPIPKRSGYSFLGWHLKSALSDYPIFSVPKKAHKKYKLYAKWRKRVYINHRGAQAYAPENTITAYYLSQALGFKYVEADVRFTADGVAVLLHDSTVNRTARDTDGNELEEKVRIESLTLEEARELDFGYWKDPVYQGEPIPTFEEFIDTCKLLSLCPYVHIKTATSEQVDGLVQTVKEAGLANKTTWISTSMNTLTRVLANNPKAQMSYVRETLTASVVASVMALVKKGVDITVTTQKGNLTAAKLKLCKNVGLPVIIYTLANQDKAAKYDQYIYGFTVKE